ncbi:MAG: hypothetical protein U5N58_13525 [Actinomycetota bacterium]|nr:hypothetical protein [Actinomycetota bacterium]
MCWVGCVKQTIKGCREESGEMETANLDAGEGCKEIVSKIKNKFGINDD